jgi:hypothetical protein
VNFWSFCGMGPYVVAVPYGGTQTGPFVWAQQGQNNSFVQPTNAPGARIGAIVGQFLMVGDILQTQTQVIGTGDGIKATFNFGLNNIPMLNTGSVYDQAGLLAGSFQNGQILGSGLLNQPTLPGPLASIGDTFNGGVYVNSQFSMTLAADPGQAVFTTITANGVTLNSSAATYSYVGGVATWVWTTGPFAFGSGVTYAVTFTGAAFLTSILAGSITTSVNGYSPYTLNSLSDSYVGGAYNGTQFVLQASSDPGKSLFTSISANGVTLTSASATYSYSGGLASWVWSTGPFGFTNGSTYPISFAGSNFFSSIIAGSITMGGGTLRHPFSLTTIGYDIPTGIGTNTALAVFTGYQLSSATGSLSLVGSSSVNYLSGNLTLALNAPPPVGDQIYANYTQAVPYRVQWSAIGDPTNWPIPLTANAVAFQSGFEDLEVDLGPVKFIAGYPLYGVIFQEFGITRANYVGGNVVFSFAVISKGRGLIARGAACRVGGLVYFIAQDGAYVTDGSSVEPIGTDQQNNLGIDKWFFENVNASALEAIRSGYDSITRNVYFAVPTGSNTLPDTLLAYNTLAQKWTKSAIPVESLWTDTNAGTTPGSELRLGLFTQSHQASTLSGPTLNGYLETCDLMDVDGDQRFTMGIRPNIACTDTPQAKAGVRNSLSDPLSYSAPAAPDAFSRIAPALVTGIYTRINVSSSAATAFTGATVYQQEGGSV